VKINITELPFNSLLGIRPATDAEHLLLLPSGGQYLNHLGTVHAGAQLALAEASSGELLLKHIGSSDGLVPVLRRVEAKFRNLANAPSCPPRVPRLTLSLGLMQSFHQRAVRSSELQ
jgi:hypothetical protein